MFPYKSAAGRWCVLLLTILLGLTATAVGQETKGKIVGTVTDASGGVVPGVKLSAVSDILPIPITTLSDDSGRFNFEALPVGTYAVTATKEGFQTLKTANVAVRLGGQVDLNIKLTVGQLASTVEVTEASVSLDVTSSRTATNITAAQLDRLPAGRSFNTLLQVAPGVRREVKNGSAGVGGYQVDGASGAENSFVIDGVDVSDIRRGSLREQNAIPPEFVQEIEVKSSGFEAQYGGASGGVINVVTRGGSNDFHGQFMLQFQNDQMNPRPRGYYKLSPIAVNGIAAANVADFFAPPKDQFRTLWPGGIFSGPLVKNKIFFTTSYFPTFTRTERINHYERSPNNTALGARQFTREDIQHFFMSRLDYAASEKLQVNTSYIWSPLRRKGLLANNDIRVAPAANDLSVTGGWQPSQAYTASVVYSFTSRFLASVRYGYKYQNDKVGNYGLSGAPYNIYRTASSAAGLPVPADVAGGLSFANVSSTFGVVKDITTRHNVYADLSNIVNIAGQQHTFKYGYSVARIGNDVDDDYANGQFDIYWGDAFSRGPINGAKGTYGYYIWQDGVRHKAKVSSRNQGLYFQDTWRASRRLTLNLGLRFENEFLPPYLAEQGGIQIAKPISFGWKDKIAPRLGAAYDLFGDGRWKLSGSFGMYYDVMKYELARGSFGGDYWISHVYQLNSPNVLSLSKTNPAVLGTEITSYNNRTVDVDPATGQIRGVDPDIKPFKQRRFNAAIEHQFASRWTGSLRYTRTDVLNGIEDIGVLNPNGDEDYVIGNPGSGLTRDTKSVFGGKTPNGKEFLVPKATREYNAVEARVQGQWKTTNVIASYTWSRLYGNWSGLANSDEGGRQDPGVSRAFDLPYYYFDQSGSQKNVFGLLGTDRPHEIKLFINHDLKWKFGTTTLGLAQFGFSGTPDTTTFIYQSAPTSPFGRGDLGRTPFYTQSDLTVAHSVRLGERTTMRLEATALNALNQAVVVQRITQLNRAGAITETQLPLSQFFGGYDARKFVFPGNTAAPYAAIYGLPSGSYRTSGAGPGGYQAPRDFRLGLRLTF